MSTQLQVGLVDKEIRSALRNIVARCRRLLKEAVLEAFEGQFGIQAGGTVEITALMQACANDHGAAGARDAGIIACLYVGGACAARRCRGWTWPTTISIAAN